MKKVYCSRRLSVSIPSTKGEWFATAIAIGALVAAIRGDSNTAWHMLEVAMLVEILEAVKP